MVTFSSALSLITWYNKYFWINSLFKHMHKLLCFVEKLNQVVFFVYYINAVDAVYSKVFMGLWGGDSAVSVSSFMSNTLLYGGGKWSDTWIWVLINELSSGLLDSSAFGKMISVIKFICASALSQMESISSQRSMFAPSSWLSIKQSTALKSRRVERRRPGDDEDDFMCR